MRWFLQAILFTLVSCSSVFYQPSPNHFFDPAQFKLIYEDVWFNAKDGIKLHGWFFPAQGNSKEVKGTIVQFHGNGENISTHFMSLVWLVNEGYNLFTFDYRGYAKSKGKSSQAGIYLDALAAIEKGYAFHQEYGKGHFIIYGQSTGGIISLRALPDSVHFKEVTLLVQDASYSSYQEVAFDRLKSSWLLFPISPLAYLLISDEYGAYKVLNKIIQPTLVIVGQKDEIIPQKFGKEIFKGISAQKKWLWKMPTGRHIDTFHHAGGKYRRDFLSLLDQLSQR